MGSNSSDLLLSAMKANSTIWLTNPTDIINIRHRQWLSDGKFIIYLKQ